jgi:hypothetical protein
MAIHTVYLHLPTTSVRYRNTQNIFVFIKKSIETTVETPVSLETEPHEQDSFASSQPYRRHVSPRHAHPPVLVQVTLQPGTKPLLQISVTAPGRKQHFYLVDPNGGTLNVFANGGAGGSGGRGGNGGSGGSGGVGTPNGSSGSSGNSGRNGFDGSPGRAGSITIHYDPQTKPFLSIIRTFNTGGPAPVFNQQPIAPLW